MNKQVKKITIRPLGFCSILFLALALFCLIGPVIQNIFLLTRNIKDKENFFRLGFSSFLTILILLVLCFIFLFPILGQKVVVYGNKMSVYRWGKNKWSFDLSVPHEAELGFHYQDKIDKFLHHNRKYLSIQVKTGKEKTCFPVTMYSTKQTQTIIFILNNPADVKIKDDRLKRLENGGYDGS